MNPNREQPSDETKLRTLAGSKTGWGYRMAPPPVPTTWWSNRDWINWIGDGWYRLFTPARPAGVPAAFMLPGDEVHPRDSEISRD
jgi:hypothetical protein